MQGVTIFIIIIDNKLTHDHEFISTVCYQYNYSHVIELVSTAIWWLL